MTLIVGQNTYISQADAEAYADLAGLDALTDPVKSLKQATLALDRLYGARFIGLKDNLEQPLMWPRRPTSSDVDSATDYYLVDSFGNYRSFTGIPIEVAHATVELAMLIESGTNVYAQSDPVVKQETIEVDVIRTSRTYHDIGYRTNFLHKIHVILAPLLTSAASFKLVR
jgi:hypothetical protein